MFVRIESLVTAGRSFRYAKFIGTMKLFFHLDFILCNSEHSLDDDALKNETKRIIPGHDPLVWDRHPSWATANGNQVAEVNLRDGEKSRKPHRALHA
jgi:hypothetical protein